VTRRLWRCAETSLSLSARVSPKAADPSGPPRVREYLARLPDGVASHPRCLAKAAMLRRVLAERPLTRDEVAALPPPVGQIVTCPPLDGEWVSDVHLVCILFAIADAHGMSDDAYLGWLRALNARMFATLFRSVVHVPSPEAILARVPESWSVFHRGSTLSVSEVAPGRAVLRLTFPPWLFHGLALLQFVPVFEAALEASGEGSAVECTASDELGATFVATWRTSAR
jgi:hypothetical protein